MNTQQRIKQARYIMQTLDGPVHQHIDKESYQDIIDMFEKDLMPVIEIAEICHVTRQAIYRVLRKCGVDTTKRQYPVSCNVCGKEFTLTKGRLRRQKHVFCSRECYFAFLKAGNGYPYIQNRHGQRIARSVVSKYFTLGTNHIVHHENRNTLDNRVKNLKVFRNQGDHVRHHRGFDIEPAWDGSLIIE